MKRFVPILSLAVVLGLAGALPAQEAAEPPDLGFRLIVHTDNPVTAMAAKDLEKIFIKKTAAWDGWRVGGDQVKVTPIDQHDNAVRQVFSDVVHGKSVSAVERYWQKMIFSGRGVPPAKADSDAAVIAFVRANPGAIGYVSSATALGAGVKELRISE